MRLILGCALVLTLSIPAAAKVFSVSKVSLPRAKEGVVEISLASPPDKIPVALQWEMDVPARLLNSGLPQAGDALQKAGKSIACSGKWKTAPESYTFLCIAAGGSQIIGDGVIAILRVSIPADAKAGTRPVKIDKAHAVLPNLKKVQIKDTQGSITVER
jgi:hypothetical protein